MSLKIEYSSLGANLSEIIYALKSKADNEQLNLYASSKSSVSYQGTMMGMSYKVFSKCIKWIKFDFSTQEPSQAIENIILNQFQNAIKSIYLLKCKYIAFQVCRLQKAIPNLAGRLEYPLISYLRHEGVPESILDGLNVSHLTLQKIAEGESNLTEKIDEIKCSVKNFYSAVQLFWCIILDEHLRELNHLERMTKEHNPPFTLSSFSSPFREDISKLLKGLIEPIKSIVARATLIHNPHIYVSLSNLRNTNHLEDIVKERIPLVELTKLLCQQPLTSEESTRIRTWIAKINLNQIKIDLHKFEGVLKDIAETISIGLTINDSYVKLLLKLDELNCNILHLNDPTHIHKREQLCEGKIISYNGKEYVIGYQISPKKLIDQTKVFTLANDDNYVLKTSNNLFILLLENQKKDNPSEHWGIKLVDTIPAGVDSCGFCVIQEKLYTSLSQYEWTSHSPKLNDQDRKIAMIIANHLMFWQQADSVPADFQLSHLMFDKKGNLKSLKLLKKETDDDIDYYGKWQDCAVTASKRNIHVLNYIMHVSRLFEHNVAAYYKIPIIESIRTGTIVPPKSTIPMAEQYKVKLLELSRFAIDLAKECFNIAANELSREYRYSPEDALKLQEDVFGKLAALYAVSSTAGTIDIRLKDLLIAEYQNKTQKSLYDFESMLANDFKEQIAYYRSEYEEMMTYNKSAQNDEDDVKIN